MAFADFRTDILGLASLVDRLGSINPDWICTIRGKEGTKQRSAPMEGEPVNEYLPTWILLSTDGSEDAEVEFRAARSSVLVRPSRFAVLSIPFFWLLALRELVVLELFA